MYYFLFKNILFIGDITMINYLKCMLYTLIGLVIGTILVTILNYFNLVKGLPLGLITLLIPIISIIIGSYKVGKTSNQKGYIEGLKYGVIWIILFVITNLIIKNFHITSIIYYIVILLLSMFSASIGINKKK